MACQVRPTNETPLGHPPEFGFAFIGGPGPTRTGTSLSELRILSPLRLPVPPRGRYFWLSIRQKTFLNQVLGEAFDRLGSLTIVRRLRARSASNSDRNV